MFDIYKYNYVIGYAIFFIFLTILFVLFFKKISSIIDPLILQLIWLSSIFSFLVLYLIKNGVNSLIILFIGSFIFFIFIIKKLYTPIKKRDYIFNIELFNRYNKRLFFMYLLSIIILIYTQRFFLMFALHHQIIFWFLYRFKALQGGHSMSKLLETGFIPIFLYLSFLFLIILKSKRIIVSFFLLEYIFISIMSGGRGAFLDFIFSIGTFIYFYYPYFDKTFIRKINYLGIFFIPISIFLAMFISGMFNKNHQSFKQGVVIIFNRIMASGDGAYYYLKYSGLTHIKSGFMPYILSIFGIYLKHFFDFKYKNIGWQLSQLATGQNLKFAEGSNYFILLQIMVIGYYLAPFYILFLAYLTSKFRNSVPKKNSITSHIIGFFFVYNAFTFPLDFELAIFNLICFFIVFIFIFYPILKFRL